jgi:polyisoprenoid-binding protein YceI
MSTQTLNARTAAPTGTWEIDPSHSSVEAVARHMMVTKVRGLFAEFDGTVTIAETLEESTAEVRIEAASIDTRDADRDAHLRSPDFLDVESFPHLSFRSTELRPAGDDRFELDGELTIRGVTGEVTLDVRYGGVGTDPFGQERVFFSATTEIDRERWGMTWNQALETGGVLVGRKLKIELEVSATRVDA